MKNDKNIDFDYILSRIDPAELDYTRWLAVGMALHACGQPVSKWDTWSKRDPARYDPEVCEKKWKSFKTDKNSKNVGLATLLRLAGIGRLDAEKNFSIDDLEEINFLEFFSQLYEEEDQVRLVPAAPTGAPAGVGRVEAAQWWFDTLSQNRTTSAHPWNFFGVNPSGGPTNRDVTSLRYIVLECDDQPLHTQYLAFTRAIEKNFPICALIYSGGRSIHALVRVDGEDEKNYRKIFQATLSYFETVYGLRCDPACGNPARLSRTPGAMRGDHRQKLIFLRDFRSVRPLRPRDVGLIEPITWGELVERPPEQRPWLIENLIKTRTLSTISGKAKAGKSFFSMGLACALASGDATYCGLVIPEPRKILYVDMELNLDTIFSRTERIIKNRKNLNIEKIKKNLIFLPMRGQFGESALSTVLSQIETLSPDVIFLDPVYRLTNIDELDCKQVGEFLSRIFSLTAEDKSIFIIHHHRKGSPETQDVVDRPSGSGVWGRMPDLMLDLSYEKDKNQENLENLFLSFVTREVPPQPKIKIVFQNGTFFSEEEYDEFDKKFYYDKNKKINKNEEIIDIDDIF